MSTQPTAGPPISTSTLIAAEMPMALVPWTRARFGTATPQYAGLTSAQDVIQRQADAETLQTRRIAAASLGALSPAMALQDMRAAAMRVAGRDAPDQSEDDEYRPSWMRGLAMWCAVAAVVVAAARW